MVAADPAGHRAAPDKAQADGCESRADNGTGGAVQHFSGEYGWESARQRQQYRARGDHQCSNRNEQPLAAHRVDQRPAWNLAQDAGKPTDGQNEADVLLGPALIGQIKGHERSEAGLNVRHKKIQPVQTASALR